MRRQVRTSSRSRPASCRIAARQGAAVRRGLTLFEVLISLAIFVVSMAALSQLISTGVQAAARARLQTQAVLRCESKLAEVLAGVEPMETLSPTPFEDDPSWTWSLEIGSGPHLDLLELNVTVSHAGESDLAAASYSMSRYVRDPQIYADAALAAEEAAMEDP